MAVTPGQQLALDQLNGIKSQLTSIARMVVEASKDGRLDAIEALSLTMQATTMAASFVSLLQRSNTSQRADLVFVLENGRFELPE